MSTNSEGVFQNCTNASLFHFENLSKTTTAENRKEKIIAQRSQTAAEDEIGGQKESKRSPHPTH